MAVAWVPVVIAWMGYDAVLGAMVINIYPGPHGTLKVLAAEAALLCPSLLAYALIVRRNRDVSAVSAPHLRQLNRLRERPAGTFAVMLAVPLAVVIAFVALLVGHSFLVERAWVAEGSQAT